MLYTLNIFKFVNDTSVKLKERKRKVQGRAGRPRGRGPGQPVILSGQLEKEEEAGGLRDCDPKAWLVAYGGPGGKLTLTRGAVGMDFQKDQLPQAPGRPGTKAEVLTQ